MQLAAAGLSVPMGSQRGFRDYRGDFGAGEKKGKVVSSISAPGKADGHEAVLVKLGGYFVPSVGPGEPLSTLPQPLGSLGEDLCPSKQRG